MFFFFRIINLEFNFFTEVKMKNKIKALGLKLWKDESGQGTAEYALIIVGVVALALVFKNQIRERLGAFMGEGGNVDSALKSFTHTN